MKSENENQEHLLTREQVAERWQSSTRTVDRLRALPKKHERHLKSTEITKGIIRFRLKDVLEYERRYTKHSNQYFSSLPDDELDELDPAFGISSEEE